MRFTQPEVVVVKFNPKGDGLPPRFEEESTPAERWGRFHKNMYDIAEAGLRQAWALMLLFNPQLIPFFAAFAPARPPEKPEQPDEYGL